MEHKVKIFKHAQFGELRVVMIEGEPWFVGKDVASALGYSNPQRAIRDYVNDADKRREQIATRGGMQTTILINKSATYSLILDSPMPTAKEFRHWVTREELLDSFKTAEIAQKCVYVLLMSNSTVKIGYTGNFERRRRQIEMGSGLTVIRDLHTPYLNEKIARLIESLCHIMFSSRRIKGEFFSVEFSEVCAKVNYFLALATAAPITVDFEHDEKSFKIADKDKV